MSHSVRAVWSATAPSTSSGSCTDAVTGWVIVRTSQVTSSSTCAARTPGRVSTSFAAISAGVSGSASSPTTWVRRPAPLDLGSCRCSTSVIGPPHPPTGGLSWCDPEGGLTLATGRHTSSGPSWSRRGEPRRWSCRSDVDASPRRGCDGPGARRDAGVPRPPRGQPSSGRRAWGTWRGPGWVRTWSSGGRGDRPGPIPPRPAGRRGATTGRPGREVHRTRLRRAAAEGFRQRGVLRSVRGGDEGLRRER